MKKVADLLAGQRSYIKESLQGGWTAEELAAEFNGISEGEFEEVTTDDILEYLNQ